MELFTPKRISIYDHVSFQWQYSSVRSNDVEFTLCSRQIEK